MKFLSQKNNVYKTKHLFLDETPWQPGNGPEGPSSFRDLAIAKINNLKFPSGSSPEASKLQTAIIESLRALPAEDFTDLTSEDEDNLAMIVYSDPDQLVASILDFIKHINNGLDGVHLDLTPLRNMRSSFQAGDISSEKYYGEMCDLWGTHQMIFLAMNAKRSA